jgi:hypothetical protein
MGKQYSAAPWIFQGKAIYQLHLVRSAPELLLPPLSATFQIRSEVESRTTTDEQAVPVRPNKTNVSMAMNCAKLVLDCFWTGVSQSRWC